MITESPLAVPLHARDTYRAGVPFAYYAWMRREAPVAHFAHPRWATGYWTVARYHDVVRVSRQAELFRSAPHPFFEANLEFAQRLDFGGIMCLDGGAHRALRGPLAPSFRPNALAEMATVIRALVRGLLDRAAQDDEQDVVAAVGRPLPIAVILSLLGVPRRQWSSVAALMEQAFGVHTAPGPDRLKATRLLHSWAIGLLTRTPDDETGHARLALSRLAEDDPRDAAGHLLSLLNAATGTTRNLIGSAIVELLGRPGVWQSLRGQPELIPAAVEELTRLSSPLIQLTRTVVEDTDIDGVRIPANHRVVLLYSSANRDETVFDDPDGFHPERSGPPHLAFGGGGPHTCLGAPLARLELVILLSELLDRFERPRLLVARNELEGLSSSTLAGYQQVPVAWSAR